MERTQPFAAVLEAVDQLSSDEQKTLVAIVQRRMAERGRKPLAADVQEARREAALEPRRVRPEPRVETS
jgi:hypothetical protein